MKSKIANTFFLAIIGTVIVIKSLMQGAPYGVAGVLVPARVKRN